jgi:hypothetical protein
VLLLSEVPGPHSNHTVVGAPKVVTSPSMVALLQLRAIGAAKAVWVDKRDEAKRPKMAMTLTIRNFVFMFFIMFNYYIKVKIDIFTLWRHEVEILFSS